MKKNYISGLLLVFLLGGPFLSGQSFLDVPFEQPVSKKYAFKEGHAAEGAKLLIDRDDNVYILTADQWYILIDGQLTENLQYRPLQGKRPVDVTIQSNTGILYYLYDDHYLSNAHAGKPFGKLESGKYDKIAVNAAGEVLVAGERNFHFTKNGQTHQGQHSGQILELRAEGEDFYILDNQGILRYGTDGFQVVVKDAGITSWGFGNGRLFVGNEQGYYAVNPATGTEMLSLKSAVPVLPPSSMAFYQNELWMGSAEGMFKTIDHENFRYYASKRWLREDEVFDVAVDSKGNGYALTKSGVSEVHFRLMNLADKADYFQEKVRKRHLRYGLIGEVRLKEAGDLTTMELVDKDNDGLWTSFYLGGEVFRYAATKDPQAKRNAMESFEAFERLLSINPLNGFPSRTFERTGYKISNPKKWRESESDEGWEWKGHTSSDEFVAYIWVAGVIYQYLDLTPAEKNRVADFIDQILSHILDNDYYLVDIDDKPTLWGRWHPEYLNMYPETVVDRKLGSLTIIAGLQLAHELTGKQKFRDAMNDLFEEHGYLDNIRIPMSKIRSTPNVFYEGMNMGDGGWNHSDDEMAFLTYWILYHFAPDEQLKEIYAEVINDHYEIEKPERNALWSLLTFGTSGEIDLPSVIWHLREFQLDMIRWDVKNSHRKDLEFLKDNFREQTTKELLPPGERKTMRYNGNPFDLDGGRAGTMELAGDEFLLPYWLGRYLNVIRPAEK